MVANWLHALIQKATWEFEGLHRVAEGYEELHRVIGYKGTGLQGKVKQNIVLYLALCDFDCVTADSSVP